MSRVWTRPLAEFRDAAAANQPTPGCGAVAAVSADLGLALVLKGLRISDAHERTSRRRQLLEAAESMLGRPGAFADDDMQAFEAYLDSLHDDPEARQQASRQACAVPLATARSCLQALELAVAAWPQTALHVRSDVHAGALLIHAALSAVLLNVDADLAALGDRVAQQQTRQARRRLQDDADRHLHILATQQASEPC